MTKRTSKSSSVVFKEVLSYAEAKLIIDANSPYEHKGLRGDERAAFLSALLQKHLPDQFAIGKGEAIDCFDNRTGELDLYCASRRVLPTLRLPLAAVLRLITPGSS
jgi:hypothetical protein